MHLKEGKEKNKGFLMLSVFLIVTLLLGSLIVGYRIIYSKGQKIMSALKRQKLKMEKESVESITYSEFYRIDSEINKKKIKKSLEYFAKNNQIKRIWEEKSGDLLISSGGYRIKRIIYDGKTIYTSGNGNFYLKMQKILRNDMVKNSFKVELEKKIENKEIKLKFIVKIILEYKFRNTILEAPDIERIEEIVVSKYV